MAKPNTFPTKNDLAPDARGKAVALLNRHLADTFDLYSQTKQAHWDVKGMQFQQLHALFDTLAGVLEGHVDLIAERATAHGGTEFTEVSRSLDKRLWFLEAHVTS